MRTRNAFLTTMGVLAALVLVAIAARGSTSVGDDTTRKPSDALLDVFFSLYIVGLIGGAVMFVYLLMLRRQVQVQQGVPRRSLLQTLATLFLLVGVSALFARRLAGWERPAPIEPEEGVGQGGTLPTETASLPATAYEAEVAWIPVLLTIGLIVLAVAAWWISGRARRRARGELETDLAAAVAQAVDESLDDLRAEPDPRRAVIATYARLEHVLAAHGLPRRPSEAPLEYLGRMLAALSVGDEAARALTDLFERAKFSQHAVGPEMKDEAIAALETVRNDLLAARALAEQARATALEAQRAQAAR